MKTSKALKLSRVFALLAGWNVCLFTGCAFEVENPDNPSPISPRRGTTSDRSGAGDSANSPSKGTAAGSQPAANIPLPTVNCNVSISRGAANSSGKEGAVIELTEASASDGSTLLLRTLSTSSFVEVKDIVFSTGVFSAGSYIFEYHKPSGMTCFVRLNIDSGDIEQKLRISITAGLPQ
jgi:hypothetical protein